MRMSISAQSAASTPPASDRIVMSASRSSYSPLRRVVTSSSLIALTVASNSISASRSPEPSGSSAASSKRTGRSSTRRRRDFKRTIVDCTLDNLLVTACAFSGSSQRLGTPAWASSSTASASSFGRSRTFSIETRVASISAISRLYSRAMGKGYLNKVTVLFLSFNSIDPIPQSFLQLKKSDNRRGRNHYCAG